MAASTRSWGILTVIALVALGGSATPASAQSPSDYFLPAPKGTPLMVTQGNDTGPLGGDHTGVSQFAYDFESVDGSGFPVAASRAGVVKSVRSDVADGNCPETGEAEPPACWTEVNHVVIDQLDGTAALYLNLAEGSSAGLQVGEGVLRGQPLGVAGSSGWTDGVKLHFMVMGDEPAAGDPPPWWRQSLGPVAFVDDSVLATHPEGIPGQGMTTDGPFDSGNPGHRGEAGVPRPLARPSGLPGRLPWPAGDSLMVDVRGVGAPDGFGFDVTSQKGGRPLDAGLTVYPLFGGTVRYAGCATGDSARLGRIVVVERTVDEHAYQAIYSHLDDVAREVVVGASLGANDGVGTYGDTVTSLDGTCNRGVEGPIRLHVAVLRDALVTPSGEILGGRAVEPWPLLGAGWYEPLRWWKGPMTAVDLDEDAQAPSGSWAAATSRRASHIGFGQRVDIAVQARDDSRLREVRLLARYDDWPARKGGKFRGLDPRKTWRLLAVCRPPADSGVPGTTKGCTWNGDGRAATVSYRWRPDVADKRGAAPWLPPARAAISLGAARCVPVTLAFQVIDASGRFHAPRGKVAKRCDAKASGLGRTVYLDPVTKPAAPTAAKLVCTVDAELGCVKYRLDWKHPSADETGLRIYMENFDYVPNEGACKVTTRTGPWLLATVPAGSSTWAVAYPKLYAAVDKALGKDETVVDARLSVSATNAAGESPRAKASTSVNLIGDVLPC